MIENSYLNNSKDLKSHQLSYQYAIETLKMHPHTSLNKNLRRDRLSWRIQLLRLNRGLMRFYRGRFCLNQAYQSPHWLGI
jgi:hypothetical protein